MVEDKALDLDRYETSHRTRNSCALSMEESKSNWKGLAALVMSSWVKLSWQHPAVHQEELSPTMLGCGS
jgi:hypothetical protein